MGKEKRRAAHDGLVLPLTSRCLFTEFTRERGAACGRGGKHGQYLSILRLCSAGTACIGP